MCSKVASAFDCYSARVPAFGGGKHITIFSGSNSIQESYSDFGSNYKHPDYQGGTEKAKSILAGSKNFKSLEIEVFVRTN